MPNSKNKVTRILMVDDNPTDILLMRRAMLRVNPTHELVTATDGEAATGLLRPRPNCSAASGPDLILLDLNMPRKDGFQVLKELKEDPGLCGIPVVIYSSSSRPEDVRRCYALHANSYISKPMSYEELIEIARMISGYWFESVLLIQ